MREKQQNTESEQIAQAELAREAQYVLEGFANRSLFFIARMKAAENVKPRLFICIVDYALSMCICAR